MKKQLFSLVLILIFFPIYADEVWSRSVGGKTFTEAVIYCSMLNENGYTWTLPTTKELSGSNENSGNYWSSDPAADLNKNKKHTDDEDKAWFYNFSAGKREKAFVSTNMRVICIRKVTEAEKQLELLQLEKMDAEIRAEEAGRRAEEANKAAENAKIRAEEANRIAENAESRAEEAENRAAKIQNEKEKSACEYARKEDRIETWKEYIEAFPQGQCVFEANGRIARLNEEAKENAARKMIEEAEAKEADRKKRGILIWSKRSEQKMNWTQANNYCLTLEDEGQKDWRLPNIDELRTIIKNCHKTVTGGECKVSEKNGCLALSKCWQPYQTCYCDNKDVMEYSTLGDDGTVRLWSSSHRDGRTDYVWGVNFDNGGIKSSIKSDSGYVRCVR